MAEVVRVATNELIDIGHDVCGRREKLYLEAECNGYFELAF